MKLPKIRELIEAVKAIIVGPYTTSYPKIKHSPAKRFRGRLEYSNENCIGCTACSLVCPARAIEWRDHIKDGKGTRVMIAHLDECHYCGQCSANCTTRDENPPGIRHTTDFELAGSDRARMVSMTDEKELELCECCGDVITTKQHLGWIAKRLGPLAFSNPTLFISKLKQFGFAKEAGNSISDSITRPDRIKILCASCRRKATIER